MLYKQLYTAFYPKWDSYWRYILNDTTKCNSSLKWYHGNSTNLTASNIACAQTAICVINETEKNIETQTASTGVLLGLLPTILSNMGSNPVELALLNTHRPLLCFLLVVAAPVVNPVRLFDFVDPGQLLNTMKEQSIPPKTGGSGSGATITGATITGGTITGLTTPGGTRSKRSIIIVVLQYLLAVANVVNVIVVIANLYGRAWSVVLACTYRYLIFVWSFLVVALWSGGVLTLYTRAEFGQPQTLQAPQSTSWLVAFLKTEFSTCKEHDEQEFTWSKENWWFLIISQLLTAGTVAHIFFGTAIFSSFQFIAPTDAAEIVARLFASAWVSRLILKYELVGLVKRTTVK